MTERSVLPGDARPNSSSFAGRMDALIHWATMLSRPAAWRLTAAAFAAVAFVDWLTGPDIWLGPLYLFVICVPTWTLGARAGFAAGLTCFGVGTLINGFSIYPSSGFAAVWTVAMRFVAIAMVLTLVAGFRRSHDREWRKARIDQGTGAMTRQGFFEHVDRLRGGGRTHVLAYIDLDDFKQVNDRHGHAAGDEVLRLFAVRIAAAIGDGDTMARIGGDEFLVHIAADDEAAARRTIESLHVQLNAMLALSGYGAGCSIGALLLDREAPRIGEQEVKLADRLMYLAKHDDGRGLRIAARDGVPAFHTPVLSIAA
jgi:diguanylate cyclase (GGDEF)-like protein